ncbi:MULTISPECIES: DUF2946 family protein [unclassified Duganella]|uniref:DUF2946 family protein n=1 Tax=unclassified Duganella TaxID=2636909 RepID=UPI000890C10D|nr:MULTISPECIES: DUF2946 family protein [unclassified Duganella]SDG21730.1 Protein of unknown function [Duganella sp. OV458]SDJ26586.1 Protein of unknown function [Duganella sp. OV510]
MDDIVKQALAKWPNVPHCYGWLGLDARGHWRMRDERAQHLNLPGDKLSNAALVGFITRNYAADERGCWYFQNGPQRVYVQLEATPYIVRTDPSAGLLLHTGAALGPPDAVLLTSDGTLILCSGDVVAQLDDRDFADVLPRLLLEGAPVGDEVLLEWMAGDAQGVLSLDGVAIERIAADQLATRFGFVSVPSAPTAA